MDRWIADWTRTDPEWMPYYTRANAGETLPEPASPLGWTFVFEQAFIKGWIQGFVDMGLYAEGDFPFERPALLGLFGGYFYLNLSQLRVMGLRLGIPVDAFDTAFVGNHPDLPPYVPHPRDLDQDRLADMGRTVTQMLARTGWPEVDAHLARLAQLRAGRPDLSVMSDQELLAHARSFQPELETAWYWHDWTTLASTLGPGMLGGVCGAAGRPEATLDLIAGLGDLPSLSPAWDLWDLGQTVAKSAELTDLFDRGGEAVAEALAGPLGGDVASFADSFEDFIARFGSRGPNEWDMHSASWEAEPAQVVALIDRIRLAGDSESPATRRDRLTARREASADEVRALLVDQPEQLATLELALRSTTVSVPAREATKALAVLSINEVRMAFRELGRRGVEAGLYDDPNEVTMLLAVELDDYVADPARFASVLAERRVGYRELFDLEPPFFLTEDPKPLPQWARRSRPRTTSATPAEVLSGMGGSAGVYTGRTRVITDPARPEALEPGDVLVAPFTDAAWTPLFLVAGAVVADVGGINSHAVVVARELGIPCVVSATDASVRIPDGSVVTVDGAAGTVTLVSTPG